MRTVEEMNKKSREIIAKYGIDSKEYIDFKESYDRWATLVKEQSFV